MDAEHANDAERHQLADQIYNDKLSTIKEAKIIKAKHYLGDFKTLPVTLKSQARHLKKLLSDIIKQRFKRYHRLVKRRGDNNQDCRLNQSPSDWRADSSRIERHQTINKLSIGIVIYNNRQAEIDALLSSLKASIEMAELNDKAEISLLNNGTIRNYNFGKLKQLKYKDSEANHGYGKGHNMLMAEAFASGSELYLAVNPDGRTHPKMLRNIVNLMIDLNHSALIDCLQFPCEHPKPFDDMTWETPWASGACLAISKKLYEEVGGFDESFFMYCEDVDLSWRARAAGFAVKTAANALFLHRVSNRQISATTTEQIFKSGLILAIKWGNKKFAKFNLRQLKVINQNAVSLPPIEKVARSKRNYTCFLNDFSFCEPRW